VNRLFIELYLDEDVHVRVAALLRRHAFAATTAREEGQLQKSDPEQLAYAVSQYKTLLTHNRADFEVLARSYYAAGLTHYGIIIAVRRPPEILVQRLLPILNQVTADEIQDQIRYI
jgi:hypothetical protein